MLNGFPALNIGKPEPTLSPQWPSKEPPTKVSQIRHLFKTLRGPATTRSLNRITAPEEKRQYFVSLVRHAAEIPN